MRKKIEPPIPTHTHTFTMPIVSFRTSSGKRVSFKGKQRKKSKRSPKQVQAHMKGKGMHPKMIQQALARMK